MKGASNISKGCPEYFHFGLFTTAMTINVHISGEVTAKMEYVAQIEKTVDILSFLLSKIPLDFDGEGSYLTNSLQLFISELKHQQLSKADSDDQLKRNWNEEDKTILSAGNESQHPFEENQCVSAILDESPDTPEEYPPLISANDESSDMILIQEKELEQTKTVKRKYTRKIKTEDEIKQEYEKEKVDLKDINIDNKNLSGEGMQVTKSVKSFKFHCCLCNCNFENEEDLRNHDLEHHCINETFQCDNCIFTAATKKSLIEHQADQHKESKIFRRKQIVNKGVVGYGYQKLKYCRNCDQIFVRTEHLKKHLYDLHNVTVPTNQCLMCLREFESEKNVYPHMRTAHIGLKIKCMQFQCTKIFDTDEEYQNHFSEKHQKAEKYTCHFCGKVFRSDNRAGFNRHVETHSMDGKQKPSFECKQCPKAFFFETDFKRHLTSTTHSGKVYPCTICDYNATQERYLNTHLVERHSSVRPFECEICGKGFSNIKYFQVHQKVHDTTRKHECLKFSIIKDTLEL